MLPGSVVDSLAWIRLQPRPYRIDEVPKSFMKSRTLRLGIVGAGMISRESHLPAALSSPMVDVTAIVDSDRGRAERLARDYGIEVVAVSTIEEAAEHIDAAIVATPNDAHADIAIYCLKRGIHVLVEKPLATTVEDGVRITQAAKQGKAVLAVGYVTRFRPATRLLKQLLDENYFGTTHGFVNRFGSPGGWSPLSAYNLNKDAAGGGVLLVTGTHFLDRMISLWGTPASVSMRHDGHGGPEANCVCRFEYENGLRGCAIFSKTVSLPAGTVIETEAGTLLIGEFDDSEIVLRPRDNPDVQQIIRSRTLKAPDPNFDSFEAQIDRFAESCLEGKPVMVDGEIAVESLKLIERLYESATSLTDQWY